MDKPKFLAEPEYADDFISWAQNLFALGRIINHLAWAAENHDDGSLLLYGGEIGHIISDYSNGLGYYLQAAYGPLQDFLNQRHGSTPLERATEAIKQHKE